MRRLGAGLAVLALAAAAAAGIPGLRERMVDFQVNYEAGRRLRMGETLYRAEDGHYQFKYPPFSALLYVPVSFLAPNAAKSAWSLLVMASVFLVFLFSYRLARPGPERAKALAVLPPLILAKCWLRELSLGQINAFITVLMLGMLLILARGDEERSPSGRGAAAGALWGLSTALKPYAAIFLPYWTLKRKATVLASGIATLAAAYAVPALYYGFPGNALVHREWVKTLSLSTPALFETQDNVSLIAMFTKWTGRPGLSRGLYLSSLLLLALLFLGLMVKGRKRAGSLVLESSLLLVLIPLISPLGWDYTLLSSALAVMLVLKHFGAFPLFARIVLVANFAVLGLSLYDLMGRALYARFMALSVPTVSALVIAGSVAWLRAKELA